jgi:hypothetical protein
MRVRQYIKVISVGSRKLPMSSNNSNRLTLPRRFGGRLGLPFSLHGNWKGLGEEAATSVLWAGSSVRRSRQVTSEPPGRLRGENISNKFSHNCFLIHDIQSSDLRAPQTWSQHRSLNFYHKRFSCIFVQLVSTQAAIAQWVKPVTSAVMWLMLVKYQRKPTRVRMRWRGRVKDENHAYYDNDDYRPKYRH